MLFSVVIPTFNRRDLLREALASVWAQSCTDYEVIVVDNGSTDGTCEDLAAAGDRLIVVAHPEGGAGGARNAGIARAQGEYIAFLDSDDLWLPWTLAVVKQFIEAHAPAMLTGCIREFRDPSELATIVEQPPAAQVFDDFLAAAPLPLLVGSNSLVVRRDIARASGGFVPLPINGEDQDWMLRLGTAGRYVSISAPATLAWRRHEGSATADLSRSITGSQYLIQQERSGRYPGGGRRAAQRRALIGRVVRPVSMACLQRRLIGAACRLYFTTFLWHVRALRLRYLIGFPLVALASTMRTSPRQR